MEMEMTEIPSNVWFYVPVWGETKVVKLGGGGREREKAGDEEECGAVSQSVSGKGDYAELRAVIEHRRARPHLHLSLLPALIGSCTWNATSVESMLWAGTNNPVAPGRPAIL